MAFGTVPKIVAIIPARHASTRFPGKVVAPLAGKPLVIHTYERTCQASLVSEAIIATDDDRVRDAAQSYGAAVVMTRAEHPSGTDRIAEVAETLDADIIVNVQADEPLIDPATIDATIQPLLDSADVPMATARHLITDPRDLNDPNVVKVVCDPKGRALYFSRASIPHVRDAESHGVPAHDHWQHIGLYVYRKDFLLEYARMSATPLEKLENLEQLRVLENGYRIAVVDTEYRSIGVDTSADLERVRELLEQELTKA
jgi:3-deoxy-manno-octulosonate cytidylyltransferase (CMP-KDO synthetase)